MWDRLAKLIDLKSIITILMVGGLVFGWFLNKVTSEQFIPLVTMILTFYFAKKDSTGGQV
jgi:hypothetical protein